MDDPTRKLRVAATVTDYWTVQVFPFEPSRSFWISLDLSRSFEIALESRQISLDNVVDPTRKLRVAATVTDYWTVQVFSFELARSF